MLLKGEIALITGGSRGIGRACSIALAREGAEVIVNYVSNEAAAMKVCDEIKSFGGSASTLKFDIGNPTETQEALQALLKEKKLISILVNNAGI
ncbi:SDR family NAD(P)-dependent oxidoreductase, partial [bacterium]|nr:SDR family NAD(P)-dependent oxidoreductase [bacterium]